MVTDLGLAPGDLTVPIVVLVGSLDQVEKPGRLRAIFKVVAPDAHFEEITGVGHLAPLEAPSFIADACRKMLAAIGEIFQA
jgi:pimeloyl-ACP methyl ester carboxylesterase